MTSSENRNVKESMPTRVAVDSKATTYRTQEVNGGPVTEPYIGRKTFKVLVEKQYIIGHYVQVEAQDADDAHNKVVCAFEEDEPKTDIMEAVEDAFLMMEDEIDDTLAQTDLGTFILNTPPFERGTKISEQEGWGRPLVIEVKGETAIIAA